MTAGRLAARAKDLWLRIKRALNLAAPKDGICTWRWNQHTITTTYDRVLYETIRWKCVLVWGHGDGSGHGDDHDARRVE